MFTANVTTITFESELEEVDDNDALSFKSVVGLRRYLLVFLVKESIYRLL